MFTYELYDYIYDVYIYGLYKGLFKAVTGNVTGFNVVVKGYTVFNFFCANNLSVNVFQSSP